VLKAIRTAYVANHPSFIIGDRSIIERFAAILEAFQKTDVRFYPQELMRARMLQAEARILLGDAAGAQALIREYTDRIYKIDGGRRDITKMLRLDCQARVGLGEIEDLGRVATARARALAAIWPSAARKVATDFHEFIGFDKSARARDGVLTWTLAASARAAVRLRVPGSSLSRRGARFALQNLLLFVVAVCLYALRWGDFPFRRQAQQEQSGRTIGRRDVVVSRAQGGIGDLMMMTPGLRALSKRHSTRVKLLIDKKYFDLFRNNPHVEVFDIDGPPIDVTGARAWRNLTMCPAARYESARRPFVKKGRVELFARGMGVGRVALYAHGWNAEYVLDDGQIQFRDAFLSTNGLGGRPVVGVQPYARDSYKDHEGIAHIIQALRADYDVIIFHHLETDLAKGPGAASTAGLSLAESIAVTSALHAMVCVDSAFLHVAAAFDVPVIAMFGPTDGKSFTRHHRRATVIHAPAPFPCSPCWRNEDLPCGLTGRFGPSPCIAAIKPEAVLAAVSAALSTAKTD
jgi:ADP-heptose:LPS heptosyltransferase